MGTWEHPTKGGGWDQDPFSTLKGGKRSDSGEPHPALEIDGIQMWGVMDSLRPKCLAHLEFGNALESTPLPNTHTPIRKQAFSHPRGAPFAPHPPPPLQGAVCPCLPFMSEASLGSTGRRREAGRAWVEESPKQLQIAREIIPTPSQNRKQSQGPRRKASAAGSQLGGRMGGSGESCGIASSVGPSP